MKFCNFFLLLWVIFALLDPDSDSESGSGSTARLNPDPIGIRIRNPSVTTLGTVQNVIIYIYISYEFFSWQYIRIYSKMFILIFQIIA
jgi:hypothetical protein